MLRSIVRASCALLALSTGCYHSSLESDALDSGTPLMADAGDAAISHDAAMVEDAAMGNDAAARGDADTPATPVQHARCEQPLPEQLPANPGASGADGPGPLIAGCEDAQPAVECGPNLPCPYFGYCMQVDLKSSGFCAPVKPDSEPYVRLGWGEGACFTRVAPETKQSVCCAKVPGFDCRDYEQSAPRAGVPGEACGKHSDCEAGLVCAAPKDFEWGAGVGRCLCPGVSADGVRDRPECWVRSTPGPWGSPAQPLAAACVPALDPTFSIERVTSKVSLDEPFVATALDPEGRLHAVSVDEQGQEIHSTLGPQGWTSELLLDVPTGELALAFTSDGTLHMVSAGAFLVYSSFPLHAAAATKTLPCEGHCYLPTLIAGSDDSVHIAYTDEYTFRYFAGNASSWTTSLRFEDDLVSVTSMVIRKGSPLFVYAASDGNHLVWLDGADGFARAALGSVPGFGRLGISPEGELWFSFWNLPDGPEDKPPTLYLGEIMGPDDAPLFEPEIVWSQDNPRFSNDLTPRPTLGFDAQANPWIAHATPTGLVLQTKHDGKFSVIELSPDAAFGARLLMDAHGDPHVFYQVGDELRHAFRGSCAAP